MVYSVTESQSSLPTIVPSMTVGSGSRRSNGLIRVGAHDAFIVLSEQIDNSVMSGRSCPFRAPALIRPCFGRYCWSCPPEGRSL